jgi:hypothetical protein
MHPNTLFDNPPEGARARVRRAPTNSFEYVRRVKGGAWQARYWLGARAGGSLNLGLFTVAEWETEAAAEAAAGRASREFGKFYAPPFGRGLRETFAHLKTMRYARKWVIPADLLPPRVRPSGGGYVARVRVAGVVTARRLLETPGVFACPWECYDAMCEVLRREFPDRPGKGELRERDRVECARRRAERTAARYRRNVLDESISALEEFEADERCRRIRQLQQAIRKAESDGERPEFVAKLIAERNALLFRPREY